MGDLSKNFSRWEFACRCGCGFDDSCAKLVSGLQAIRDHFDVPVHVNSGCRCERHNRSVRGAARSQHLVGKAADIRVEGKTPGAVASFAETLPEFRDGGIFIYDTFVHVDTRDGVARGDFRT